MVTTEKTYDVYVGFERVPRITRLSGFQAGKAVIDLLRAGKYQTITVKEHV